MVQENEELLFNYCHHRKTPSTSIKKNVLTSFGNKLTITAATTHATSSKENTITFKNNAVMKFKKIDEALDLKLKLTANSKNYLDKWSKEYCLKTVYRGAQKLVSKNTTLEHYSELVNGLCFYTEETKIYIYILVIVFSCRNSGYILYDLSKVFVTLLYNFILILIFQHNNLCFSK